MNLKRTIEDGGIILLFPIFCFGAFSHFYAWIKCQHGIHVFTVVDEKTKDSFAVWSLMNENKWIPIIFLMLAISAYYAMRIKKLSYALRLSTIFAVAASTFWYSWTCVYLGGKFLNY